MEVHSVKFSEEELEKLKAEDVEKLKQVPEKYKFALEMTKAMINHPAYKNRE